MGRFFKILGALTFALYAQSALAGKIVANHDEWTLTNTGFVQSPDAAIFVSNIADFFTGGGSGSFFGASNNFGFTGSSLATAFTNAGHSYSSGTGPMSLGDLLTYDGIFVGGNLTGGLTTGILIDYVNAGGNVYVAAGTGVGGPAGEAALWNPFLNSFGLAYDGTTYNGVAGNLSVQPSPHPIFAGVSTLYQNNGNTILTATDPNATVFFNGLYAVYDDTGVMSVPAPSAAVLLGISLLGLLRHRRRS